MFQMRTLQQLIPHHHQLDHHYQLNREVAPEDTKDRGLVSEYLYIQHRQAQMKIEQLDLQNCVKDRSRSPQEREDSRRQGPQTQEGKESAEENQLSDVPSAKKHMSIDSGEDDEEPQNEPGTSSILHPTLQVLPLHPGPAASSQGPAASRKAKIFSFGKLNSWPPLREPIDTRKNPEPRVSATLRVPWLVRTCVHGVGSSRVSSVNPPLPSFPRQPSPPHAGPQSPQTAHQCRIRSIERTQTNWSCQSFLLISLTLLFVHISFAETQS